MLAGQSAGGSFWQPLTSQVQKGFGDGLGLPFTGTGFTSQVCHNLWEAPRELAVDLVTKCLA